MLIARYVTENKKCYYNDMEKGSFIVYDDNWFWQSSYSKYANRPSIRQE